MKMIDQTVARHVDLDLVSNHYMQRPAFIRVATIYERHTASAAAGQRHSRCGNLGQTAHKELTIGREH